MRTQAKRLTLYEDQKKRFINEKITDIQINLIHDGIEQISKINLNEMDKKKLQLCIRKINMLIS